MKTFFEEMEHIKLPYERIVLKNTENNWLLFEYFNAFCPKQEKCTENYTCFDI